MFARQLLRSNSALTRLLAVTSVQNNRQLSSTTLIKNLNSCNNISITQPISRSFSISSIKSNQTVNCPPFADSISEGDVMLVKEPGDNVTEDETVMEIETDKTSIPVPAPFAGTIVEILVEEGVTVSPGTPLYVMVAGDGAQAVVKKPEPVEIKESAPEPVADVVGKASESLGSAPSVGASPVASSAGGAVSSKAAVEDVVEAVGGPRSEERVKMNRMRQRIAQRLKDSQNTCALLTTFNEIDMTNIMALRNKYKDQFLKQHGIKLGFMSAFAKASAYALEKNPVINAVIDDATQEIVYRNYVDISVAVATPKGLVVPVVRNVEKMDYFDIEKNIHELGVKARDNKITVEDMDGGTFTISNGGVFGSLMGTPIVNPPQSAILGMHGTFERPVAIKGQVEVRPMMYVALTYDHRLVDGKDAVTFLKTIKNAVEDPQILLLNL